MYKKTKILLSLFFIMFSIVFNAALAVAQTTYDYVESSESLEMEVNSLENSSMHDFEQIKTTESIGHEEGVIEEFTETSTQNKLQSSRNSQGWGDEFITSAELLDAQGNPQTSFGLYDNMQANWEFNIPKGTDLKAGDTMTIDIPEVFSLQTNVSFDIKDAAGNVIGQAFADRNTKKITIVFTQYAEETVANGINGEFSLWVTWDKTLVQENTTVPVDWGSTGNTIISVNPANVKPNDDDMLSKWGYVEPSDPTLIHWTVRVNFAQKEIENAKYEDTLGVNQELVSGSINGFHVTSWDDNWVPIPGEGVPQEAISEIDSTHFAVDLGDLKDCVYINYTSRATDNGNSSSYANQGRLTGENLETQIIEAYTSDNGGNGSAESKVAISGTKTWIDNDNAANLRPSSITIDLYQNEEKVESKTVSTLDEWKYEFKDLPKYDENNQPYIYSVKENPVDNYVSTQEGNNFTNIISGTTKVNGTKIWDDNNNQDGKRPISIVVNLLANGEVIDTKTVSAVDDWSYEFDDLDKYTDGKEIIYTVTENAVTDYSTSINGFDITNSYTPSKTSVSITKVWNDKNNQDGIRPNKIAVQLYANGEQLDGEVELSDANDWKHTWNDLDEKAEGKSIVYTVSEVSDVTNYTPTINDSDQGNIIITNSHLPETIEVAGKKTWNDNNDQEKKRPTSIVVNLLADGKIIDTRTVSAVDDWSYKFNNLDKYADGKEILYTVTEKAVPDYSTSIDGFDITNSYTPGKTSLSMTKSWNDNNDQKGIRPKKITVQLYANNKKIASEVTLSKENNWTYICNDLDVYDQEGNTINYSVKEINVPKGYTSAVTNDNGGNWLVTNTLTSKVARKQGNNNTTTSTNSKSKSNSLPKTGEQKSSILMIIGILIVLLYKYYLISKKSIDTL